MQKSGYLPCSIFLQTPDCHLHRQARTRFNAFLVKWRFLRNTIMSTESGCGIIWFFDKRIASLIQTRKVSCISSGNYRGGIKLKGRNCRHPMLYFSIMSLLNPALNTFFQQSPRLPGPFPVDFALKAGGGFKDLYRFFQILHAFFLHAQLQFDKAHLIKTPRT